MWKFPILKTRFLSFSKSKPFHDCTAHFWSFRCKKTRFLSISKSTSLQDDTSHFSTFRTLKPLYVYISKSTLLQDGTAIIWTFRDLNITCLKSTKKTLSVRNSPYLKVLQLENGIREYQQNDHLPGLHTHIWLFRSLKKESANLPHSRAEQHICESFHASKQDSWVSANRSILLTALIISERFATWTRDSWPPTNQTLAGQHCTFLKFSQLENAIPEDQQINSIAGQHCPYYNVSHH